MQSGGLTNQTHHGVKSNIFYTIKFMWALLSKVYSSSINVYLFGWRYSYTMLEIQSSSLSNFHCRKYQTTSVTFTKGDEIQAGDRSFSLKTPDWAGGGTYLSPGHSRCSEPRPCGSARPHGGPTFGGSAVSGRAPPRPGVPQGSRRGRSRARAPPTPPAPLVPSRRGTSRAGRPRRWRRPRSRRSRASPALV